MNSQVETRLDLSSANNTRLVCDGKPVDMERAFKEGFFVPPDDAPAVLTLIKNFLTARDQFSK